MAVIFRPYGLSNGSGPKIRIDPTHSLANQLSYFLPFNGVNQPIHSLRDNLVVPPTGNATFAAAAGGVGLTGGGAFGATNARIIPPVLTPTFTVFVCMTVASWAPADGVRHDQFFIAQDSGDAKDFTCTRQADNNFYFGFNGTVDNRVVQAASGTFTQGRTFCAGGTFDGSGSGLAELWVNGVKLGSHTGLPDLAFNGDGGLAVGRRYLSDAFFTAPVPGQDAIHWFAVWDRLLTSDEIVALNANPFALLVPAEGEMPALFVAAGGSFIPAWARNSNLPVIGTGTY